MIARLWNMFLAPPDASYQALQVEMQALYQIESITPRSPRWRKVRGLWIAEHPACEVCGDTTDVDVHHVQPYHLYPDAELDPENLLTLCNRRWHHILFGHAGDWRAWNPDVRRDVARAREMINRRRYDRL